MEERDSGTKKQDDGGWKYREEEIYHFSSPSFATCQTFFPFPLFLLPFYIWLIIQLRLVLLPYTSALFVAGNRRFFPSPSRKICHLRSSSSSSVPNNQLSRRRKDDPRFPALISGDGLVKSRCQFFLFPLQFLWEIIVKVHYILEQHRYIHRLTACLLNFENFSIFPHSFVVWESQRKKEAKNLHLALCLFLGKKCRNPSLDRCINVPSPPNKGPMQ